MIRECLVYRRQMMVTRRPNKSEFVDSLHDFILQHNSDLGLRHGLSEDEVAQIMEQQAQTNKILCGHIYDFLVLEGYVERPI